MAQRVSEQVAEYLTLGGEDGFTSQTSVPLHVQGHTILGTTQTNNNNDNYKANLTTINGHLIINSSYNNHNNYSQGIRINKGTDNRALLMLGGDTGSTEGTSDTTWHIGTFPNPNNSSITDLIIARNDCQFNNEKPSLQLTNDGLTVYKRVVVDSKTSGSANAGFCLKGGSSAGSDIYSQMYISSIGIAGNPSPGIAVLELGNNKSANTTNNAKGQLRLWGSGNKYSNIETKATANRTAYLPDVSGWLVMGGNGSSTGVGSSSQPIYISTTGVATAITGTINNNAASATAANLTTTTNAITYYTNTSGTFGTKASANGALYATSTNGSLNWGTLPVGQGGTGATSFTSNYVLVGNGSSAIQARSNLQIPSSGSITSGTNIIPNTTNAYDLGSSTNKWNNIYGNLKGNADTASAAYITNTDGENITNTEKTIAYYADTHGKFGASSTFSLVTTGITTGILTKVTDDAKLGYQLENNQSKLNFLIDNNGNGGFYDPDDGWILSINKNRNKIVIPIDLQTKGLLPNYTITKSNLNLGGQGWKCIAKTSEISAIFRPGFYLTTVWAKITPQQGGGGIVLVYWSGIIPWITSGTGYGYGGNYVILNDQFKEINASSRYFDLQYYLDLSSQDGSCLILQSKTSGNYYIDSKVTCQYVAPIS